MSQTPCVSLSATIRLDRPLSARPIRPSIDGQLGRGKTFFLFFADDSEHRRGDCHAMEYKIQYICFSEYIDRGARMVMNRRPA
jgi:hypothetical protein